MPYPAAIEIDTLEVTDSNPKEWSVVAPIDTEEEGLSDLSMELSLTENGKRILKSELENIHVR